MVELEFDENGIPTILKSFCKPSKDSNVKKKETFKKQVVSNSGEENLF